MKFFMESRFVWSTIFWTFYLDEWNKFVKLESVKPLSTFLRAVLNPIYPIHQNIDEIYLCCMDSKNYVIWLLSFIPPLLSHPILSFLLVSGLFCTSPKFYLISKLQCWEQFYVVWLLSPQPPLPTHTHTYRHLHTHKDKQTLTAHAHISGIKFWLKPQRGTESFWQGDFLGPKTTVWDVNFFKIWLKCSSYFWGFNQFFWRFYGTTLLFHSS